jgi:hypothetical protein
LHRKEEDRHVQPSIPVGKKPVSSGPDEVAGDSEERRKKQEECKLQTLARGEGEALAVAEEDSRKWRKEKRKPQPKKTLMREGDVIAQWRLFA